MRGRKDKMPIKRTKQENEKFKNTMKMVCRNYNLATCIALAGVLSGTIVSGFIKGWNSVPAKGLENSVKSAQVSPIRPEEKRQDYSVVEYITKPGETFPEIAKEKGYDIDFLKKFNPQFKEKGYVTEDGDIVYMPKLEGERK